MAVKLSEIGAFKILLSKWESEIIICFHFKISSGYSHVARQLGGMDVKMWTFVDSCKQCKDIVTLRNANVFLRYIGI